MRLHFMPGKRQNMLRHNPIVLWHHHFMLWHNQFSLRFNQIAPCATFLITNRMTSIQGGII